LRLITIVMESSTTRIFIAIEASPQCGLLRVPRQERSSAYATRLLRSRIAFIGGIGRKVSESRIPALDPCLFHYLTPRAANHRAYS